MAQAVAGENIVIKGSGRPIRSFMHLGDMVFWVMTILFQGRNGEDYNVGSKNGISMLELAREIVDVLETRSEIIILGESDKTSGNSSNYFYVPDTSQGRKRARFILSDGIENIY